MNTGKHFLLIFAVVVIGVTSCKRDTGKRQDDGAPVTIATVAQKAIPLEVRTFGTVEAYSTVQVKSLITGTLTACHIAEGQDVKHGELLFTIDPRPTEAALKEAEAGLAKDTAQRINAEKEAKRQAELLKSGFAAEDASDQAKSIADSFAAAVKADEAAVENARVQLEYCSIRSPINGRAGQLMIHPGNIVKANDATLLTINQIKPIKVSFTVPQQRLPELMKAMSKGKLEARAIIPDEPDRPESGELAFLDNMVDSATGTIQLKAGFQNHDGRLWPGQFVNIILTLSVQTNAIVIPSQAVMTGQKGSYVFVLKPDMTVENRDVILDRVFNGETVISQGLSTNEQVVTDGQLRIGPGSKVAIKASTETKNKAP